MTSLLLETSLLSFLLPFLLMWVVRPLLHRNIFAEYCCNILSAYYSLIFPSCLFGWASAQPHPTLFFFSANLFLYYHTLFWAHSTFYCLKSLNLTFKWFILL